MSDMHRDIVRDSSFALSSKFTQFDVFEPLSVVEYRSLSMNPDAEALNDTQLDRLWVKPIQRWLQQEFRIDQRNYDDGTIPTLAALTEDFKVAASITIDVFLANEEEVLGQQQIAGAGSRIWSHKVPARAAQLLERYARSGGRVGRA